MKKTKRKSEVKRNPENFKEFMNKFLQDVLVGTFGGFVFYILQSFAGLSRSPISLGILLVIAIGFISGWCFILGVIMWWFRQRED